MNGGDSVVLGEGEDGVEGKISADRITRFTDEIGFIRLETMQGVAIFMGVHGHVADAQFMGRAKYANSYLAAIGDEELTDGFIHGRLISLPKSGKIRSPSLYVFYP